MPKQSETETGMLPPTNEDTVGPYFPDLFCERGYRDLSQVHPGLVCAPEGRKIILKGRLLDRHGQLAGGVVVEFWQANSKGVYRNPNSRGDANLDPWFEGFSRIRSIDGRFELTTIKPGRQRRNRNGNGNGGRAPNITLTIFSDGISRIATQVFFADEESNANDPLLQSLPEDLRSRLIARHDGRRADGAEVYAIDIVLAGAGETPFFEDLLG